MVFVEAFTGVDETGAVPYNTLTYEVQLPVDAPVVTLDMVSIDTGSLLAVATPTAVYVYAFEGEERAVVGGYDLERGEGTVLDLGFAVATPHDWLSSARTSRSMSSTLSPIRSRSRPSCGRSPPSRTCSSNDALCQELVGRPCPTGAG